MSTTILDHFDDIDRFETTLDAAEATASTEREMEFVDSIRNKYDEYGERMTDLRENIISEIEHFGNGSGEDAENLADRILAILPPQPKLEWDDMDCLRVGKVVVGYVGLCRTEDKEKKRAAVEQAVKEALGWTR